MKQQPQIPSTMLPGQLFGSSHLDSSQGKQTRARVPDSPSSRASRNSHPAAARCQPPSPPGRLLPAETAARYIPAAAARPGPGGASRKPPRWAADPSVPRLLPAAPASGPPRKVSSLGGGGSSQTSPPGGGSARRCPLREAASLSPVVPRPPAPGSAAPCVRAAERAAAAASPSRPEPRLASCLTLAPLQVRPLPCPHWAIIAAAPPQVPVRASLIGHRRGWPAPFPPAPPQPQILGLEEAQRRRGAAWAPQRPPPPPPPAPPLPLPGLWARSGAGRRRQTAGTGWRRPGGHRGRGGRGPRKGRSPSRAMVRGAVNGASSSTAVAARASSSACSLEGRGDPVRGAPPRPLSPSATGGESRSLPAPPRSVPAAALRARPGAPRVRGAVANPLRGGGTGCPAPAAVQRCPGPPLCPLINKRQCRRSPADFVTESRPRAACCSSPALGQRRPRLPAALPHRTAAVTAQSRPGSRGPAAARSAGAARAKDGPERRREVRRRCGGGAGPARPAGGSARRGARSGGGCLPRAGARGRREGKQEERCYRRSECCLVCGRQRRQETGGSWPPGAAPRYSFREGPAATVSCPAQGAIAALGATDPAVRNARNWDHLEYETIGSASGFCQLQGAEPGKAWTASNGASSLGRRVWNLNRDYYREAKTWFLQFLLSHTHVHFGTTSSHVSRGVAMEEQSSNWQCRVATKNRQHYSVKLCHHSPFT